ncbi:MAG: acyl-ACP--UDP-N-acetylglucosamine O-acyltransferase [Selenomonadaceae bacterium]|nr:acyl-ACP--UDP-N-acetylglucosamine O-acyltransferase [Selenomonadaceae bacterium]
MTNLESNGELIANNGTNIHPSAVISKSARIGENVTIGAYCVIGDEVEIGDGSIIGPHAVIDRWTTIGKDCRIFQFASVGAEPQDLKFKGEQSCTIIGDRTTIREGATIHRATGEGNETRIGNDCLLMAYIHIAHNCTLGNRIIMSNLASCSGHAIVEDRVVIGGMAGVHQFVKIGRNAMIGGMSKLVQDVVPYTLVDGHPAKVVGLNNVGISRAGIPLESRRLIKKAYKILYRSGLSLAEAIAVIEQEVDSCEEVEHFLRFLRNAERGICRERRDFDDK